MILKHIKAELPGGNFDADLSKPTIIIGPNDSGKTTLLTSAQLALQGGDMGPEGYVSLDWGNGDHIRREYYDGKQRLCFNRDSGVRKCQGLINAAIGDAGAFSASEFVLLSSNKRQTALDQSGAVKVTLSVTEAQGRLEANDWNLERLLSLSDGVVPRWKEQTGGQQYLSECREWLRELHRMNEATIRELRGAQATATEERPEGLPEGTVASWRQRIEEVHDERNALATRRGEVRGQKDARKSIELRIERIRSQQKELAPPTAEQIYIETKRKEEFELKLEKVADQITSEESVLLSTRKKIDGLQSQLDEANEQLNSIGQAAASCKAMAEAAKTLSVLINAAHLAVEGMEFWIEGSQGMKMPDCIDQLKKAVGSIAQINDPNKFEEMEDRKVAAKKQIEGHRVNMSALKRRRDRSEEAIKSLTIKRSHSKTYLNICDSKISSMKERQGSTSSELDRLIREQESLQDQLSEMPVADMSIIDEHLLQLDEALKDTQRSHDILNDRITIEASIKERNAILHEKIDHRATLVDAGKTVSLVLRDMLGEAIQPVSVVASVITEAVLGYHLKIQMDGGVQILLVRDGHSITIDQCSNSQRAVALMALQVGIQGMVDGWRSVIIDDLESLEHDRRTLFVEAMRDAQDQGIIDNFIGACVEDGWTPPEEIQTIRLKGAAK